jgi:hypothetical protein
MLSMLVKEVLRCVTSLLKEDGFHRGVYGVLLRPVCPGFEMSVGLNTATHRDDGLVGINPVVGMRQDAVENLVSELTGHRSVATLSTSLGYLMPERRYIEWAFGTADLSIAMSLRDSLRMFGYPAMESLSSSDAIIESLQKCRMTLNEDRRYRLPAAYLLQGKKDIAIQELHRELENIGERTVLAAAEFRRFAEKLEKKANAGEWDIGRRNET